MSLLEWHEFAGVALHDSSVHVDSRGNFVKLWGGDTLDVDQVCTSFNSNLGTLRGMHVQLAPALERKFVWCTAGELWDVLVDTRRDEPTYGSWTSVHLSAVEPALLEIPPGVAHGYQTLHDNTAVAYLITGTYDPARSRTLAWDDTTVGIAWPLPVSEISLADQDGQPWPLS